MQRTQQPFLQRQQSQQQPSAHRIQQYTIYHDAQEPQLQVHISAADQETAQMPPLGSPWDQRGNSGSVLPKDGAAVPLLKVERPTWSARQQQQLTQAPRLHQVYPRNPGHCATTWSAQADHAKSDSSAAPSLVLSGHGPLLTGRSQHYLQQFSRSNTMTHRQGPQAGHPPPLMPFWRQRIKARSRNLGSNIEREPDVDGGLVDEDLARTVDMLRQEQQEQDEERSGARSAPPLSRRDVR